MESKHNKLAMVAMFNVKKQTISEAMTEVGVVYRKGKCAQDFQKAITKGLKAGHGRTEMEISMIAYYISKVVKGEQK